MTPKISIPLFFILTLCSHVPLLSDANYSSQADFLEDLHWYLSPANKLARNAEIKNNSQQEYFISDVDVDEVELDEGTIPIEKEAFSFAKSGAEIGLELGSETYQVVLDPRHKTKLFAEIKYPVTKIMKKIGESFQEGELLIQLEDSVTQGNYNKASAATEKAKAELEATKQLYKDGLSSFFELKEAEANVSSAKAELILAEKNLRASEIRAPYAGVVTSLDIEEHELPQTGKELMQIIDDEVLIAKLLIPSSLLPKIAIGQPITIHIFDLNKTVSAKISRIGGMIDPSSSTIRIEAEIDNDNREFKAGTSGIASFRLELQ